MRAVNKPIRARVWGGLPLALALLLASAAHADEFDPPARVARLAQVLGQVSVAPAGLDDWALADVNRPLTSGDKLWSDVGSRVELSIGTAVIRLGGATGFSFLNLDDHTAQMQVTAGTASVHVRTMAQNETLEIDTPNVAVALLGPGDYRVDVNDAGDTSVVKVSGGTAEVAGGGEDFPVHLQQQMTFTGATVLSVVAASLGAPDDFDAWAFERDRRTRVAQTTSYVSPDVVGASDLDQNGTWQSTPDDGYVWAPDSVPIGWAPYHDGHWIWISPWGWTWVDAARWGFAPFHYGRWATFGGRWCWVPGPARVRPVYAPALVAWMGGAPLEAAALGGGAAVAWFALGPHEIYVPAYPVSQTYLRNINRSNTRVDDASLTNAYNDNAREVRSVNRNAPGAVSAVSLATFTTAEPVGKNALRLQPNEVAAARLSPTAPAIIPTKQSLLGAATRAVVPRPSLAVQNRLVVVTTTPPAAPVPFAAQQQAIRTNGGRPLAGSELAALAVYAPPARLRALAAGTEARSGMVRAAKPNPGMSRLEATESHLALTQPERAAVVSPASIARPALGPQTEAQPWPHRDRPPGAFGQPGTQEQPREDYSPRAGELRIPAVRPSIAVDRPALEHSPALTSPPPAATPAVQVVQPTPAASKAKPVVHAETAVHSAPRVNN